jgi:hypothetical protein
MPHYDITSLPGLHLRHLARLCALLLAGRRRPDATGAAGLGGGSPGGGITQQQCRAYVYTYMYTYLIIYLSISLYVDIQKYIYIYIFDYICI